MNIEEIDTQHQKLITLINDFLSALQLGESHSGLKVLLKGLSDYCSMHFQTEEDYFHKFKYEATNQHKRMHAEFLMRIGGFKSRFEAGKELNISEVVYFLRDWISNHILISDKAYKSCFKSNGL
jgi:hemerythrin-like metal-binding protein